MPLYCNINSQRCDNVMSHTPVTNYTLLQGLSWHENWSTLDNGTVLSTFRKNILPPFKGSLSSPTLKSERPWLCHFANVNCPHSYSNKLNPEDAGSSSRTFA
jgi:hypothetical protein